MAGIEESKVELEEIIEFLREPKKFTRLGGRIPKGVLLVGPPGTGKTLLARAVAGEAGVPFFSISGSDFVEMFVGVGASRVRDLFLQGKKNAPCIIFIDEIDAVGRHRGAGLGGGHDEREQTLNQLLVEMDGFESNEGVILIAATNRPDVLDPRCCVPAASTAAWSCRAPTCAAASRSSRSTRSRVNRSRRRRSRDDRPRHAGLRGRRPAEPRERGGLLAARRDAEQVHASIDFENAKDKVMLGTERKSLIMTDEDKRVTAYHEAGHALVALTLRALRPGAQGHDHSARDGARRDHDDAGGRPLRPQPGSDPGPDPSTPWGGAPPRSSCSTSSRRARRTTSSRRPKWLVVWSAPTA